MNLEAASAQALTVPAQLPVGQLSISSLQRFWRCPQDWYRHYVLGHREPSTGAMALGSAVGQAIAHHFTARLAGDAIDKTQARESFHHAFDLAAAQAIFEGDDDRARRRTALELRERGERLVELYLASPLAAYLERDEVVAVEPRHELAFPGARWSFVAYLDLVTAQGTIVDIKVKAKHLGEAEARRDLQARAYVLARRLDEAGREGGPAPRRFAFHSLRHGTRPEAIEVPEGGFLPSDRELDAFEQRLIVTARQIADCARTGDWGYASPMGWWCSERCAHWNDCPGGAGVSLQVAAAA
jgi:hypothetical protein